MTPIDTLVAILRTMADELASRRRPPVTDCPPRRIVAEATDCRIMVPDLSNVVLFRRPR
jgi:hypothetical protein